MQNAGPSTRVTELPEIVALELVVQGWATAGTLSPAHERSAILRNVAP